VGWLWYVITLIPVIGLVQVGKQAMADRYTYIPLIGLFVIVAWGVPELLANYNFRKPVLAVAATASVAAMSAVTYVNLGYWQNSETVLEHAIEVTQNNRFAEANLGVAYLQNNIYDQAIVHFEKVLQNDPNDAMTNLNIGVALFRKGKIDEAIIHFEKTLQKDPCDIAVRLNLGVALTRQGRVKEAIKYYDEALQIDPCNVDAINLRQKLLRQQQQ
jgi:tetratricopeptide (TPR) repeat protein